MTRRLASFTTACLTLSVEGWAVAQAPAGTVGPGGMLPTQAPKGSQTGVKVGEGVLMHAGIGAEAGWDSNVFYASADNAVSSPIVRVVPFIELTNGGRGGTTPDGGFWDIGASLLYREYVSSDTAVRAQRALNPTLHGVLEVHAAQRVSVGLSESFTRASEPPYGVSTGDLTRDYNLAAIQLKVAPGGGRIQGTLRLSNALEFYETPAFESGNSMTNDLMLDVAWRWLPKTAIFVRASQGMVTYFGSSKTGGFPLRAVAGIRGLTTPKLSTSVYAGYANAFYSAGASTSGIYGSMSIGADLTYQPGPMNQIAVGYTHDFRNSALIGNFFYLDAAWLSFRQLIGASLVAQSTVRYELRGYQGADTMGRPVDRTDNVITAGAVVDYGMRYGFYAGIGYTLAFDASSAEVMLASGGTDSLSYIKHQVFARLGLAF